MINLMEVKTPYAISKLFSEATVNQCTKNNLILRLGSLIGPYMRENTLVKLMQQKTPKRYGLSKESCFNYVAYNQVYEFITYAVNNELRGIYNIVNSQNVSFQEVISFFNISAITGEFLYFAGNICNEKVNTALPMFRKSSLEVLQENIDNLMQGDIVNEIHASNTHIE
ncbi:hypothetical protein OMAG_001703 [Candidatus Omnitrophus magneticus]|uniref:Uncharacterized protein n=1 Tax=Candidatus Omnitrophus magneticus TaxID=1609969 RepID=A0A0F0CME2_9BACT|nr:hypothetical protein OMAG_001703 [Candidatus Omnitrophus magneticus]